MVLAVTSTGDGNVSVCQPVDDSPAKVPVAKRMPDADHNDPVWVPVLPGPL